ncbi:MAG: hypothetical protein WCB68_12535 [Pyrinomonadaceae bacterium]
MTLSSDQVLGASYLSPQDFLDRAEFFGAQVSIADKTAQGLQSLAASASRAIDAYCQRGFSPSAITERHTWNGARRRVSVNQSPVMTLQSFVIIAALDHEIEIPVADILINNTRNFLEVTPAGAELISSGSDNNTDLLEAEVEVVYLSYQSIPAKVSTACGYTMAKMANEAYSSAQVPDGLTRIRLDGVMDVQRRTTTDDTDLLPPIAKALLREYISVAIV